LLHSWLLSTYIFTYDGCDVHREGVTHILSSTFTSFIRFCTNSS
jgi:hypothetical protein